MADIKDEDYNVDEEDDDIITLHNEQTDKDEDFYNLATLDVDKRWFIVLKPVEKLDDIADDEVLIYELVDDENGETVFQAIEDEDLLEKVFDEFMKELEKYEECDEDCECCEDECCEHHHHED